MRRDLAAARSSTASTTIAGNYDVAIARGDEDCGCGYADERDNPFAQLMYDYTRAHTSPAFAAWMAELPGELRVRDRRRRRAHGPRLAAGDQRLPVGVAGRRRARAARARERRAAAALHAHGDPVAARGATARSIVNVGAIGRPANDGRTEVWYAVIDLDDGEIERVELVRAGLRLARAGGVDARGRAARAVRRDDRDGLVDDVPGGRPAARARARRLPRLPRRAADRLRRRGAGWAAAPGQPTTAGRSSRCSAWRCSRRACGSTRTSTATSPATTASWRAPPPRARASCRAERFRALVDEALREGFAEIYLTGGEPFVHPEIVSLVEYASDRLPTVVLTNAMLFTGRRRAELARLAGQEIP